MNDEKSKNLQKFTQEDISYHTEHHKFSPEKTFDWDQITEEIFLGTNMCCEIGFSNELLSKGVYGDISLEKERAENPVGVDYFLWLPVADGEAPTQKQLKLGVQAMDFFIQNKVKFYAHCKNGHGRAPTLVIAYFVSKGMSIEDAIAKVKEKRPEIHLNEIQLGALKTFQSGKSTVEHG